MRTLLSQFCEAFEAAVRPVLGPFHQASRSLEQASPDLPARQVLPGLQEQHHQFRMLADKVAAQQAYVLIFGPLKSGKSTLMNAMTAAYVSEVTSLPAYPCMTFVSHSNGREYQITRYSNATETLHDPATLRMQVGRAHKELAEKIREAEERGEPFDPGRMFPEAIRRVEVKVPAGDLQESGAVLVDTPGLYSRMKFGYDRLTREFRNSAACAVFVVKADTLFMDQVFEEFQELLDLFSRIFLVVNLDSGKQDLRPDGSLTPSLEKVEPLRILEAFESLVMSAPLKAAAEEGRLSIYPVDLLRAASRRLTAASGRRTSDSEDPLAGQEADFEVFVKDLTEYLNSSDYLKAFLGDSIRHAETLLRHAGELCGHVAVRGLSRKVADLEAEKTRVEALATTLDRLEEHDWNGEFAGLREQVLSTTVERARDVKAKAENALSGALNGWFKSGSSLLGLKADEIGPLLLSSQAEVALMAIEQLRGQVAAGAAGMAPSQDVLGRLELAGVRLADIGRQCLEAVDPEAGIEEVLPDISPESIPVRKRLVDWLLFRGQSAIRRRLFGPPNRPSNRIPAPDKAKVLGEPARKHLLIALESHLDASFPRMVQRVAGRILEGYAEAVTMTLVKAMAERREANTRRLEYLERQLAELGRVRMDLEALDRTVESTKKEVELLRGQYAQTDAELLGAAAGISGPGEDLSEERPDRDGGGVQVPGAPVRTEEIEVEIEAGEGGDRRSAD